MKPMAGDPAPLVQVSDFETLEPVSLAETWQDMAAVLVFQRYFGCPFCQLHVARLLEDRDRFTQAGARIVLVGHGERDAIKLGKAFSPLRVLFDPEMGAYEAFEVPHGGIMQTAGPTTWLPFAKANLTPGVRQKGLMGGDFSQLPGTFVVDRAGIVRFAHRGRSASDNPPNDLVLRAISGLNFSSADADIPGNR